MEANEQAQIRLDNHLHELWRRRSERQARRDARRSYMARAIRSGALFVLIVWGIALLIHHWA